MLTLNLMNKKGPQMNKSENISELAEAFSKFQGELVDAERKTRSHSGKYAKLEDIFSIIRPLLSKQGLSFTQIAHSTSAKEMTVDTTIMHKSGQFLNGTMTIDVPPAAGKANSLQQIGVVLSYVKRYAIMGICGICQKDEDNDADELTEKPRFNEMEATAVTAQQAPKVSKEQINTMAALIDLTSSSLDGVLKHYKIESLEEFTIPAYEHLVKNLNKKLNEKGEK